MVGGARDPSATLAPKSLWFGHVLVLCFPWPDSSLLALVQIMGETLKDPVIKRCCEAANRLADLQHISEGLEKCQKSLNDYLDSKRNAFPRFFFISDDELLSILGNSDPLCVQEHMIKVGPCGPVRPHPRERLPRSVTGLGAGKYCRAFIGKVNLMKST